MLEITARELIDYIKSKEIQKTGIKSTDNLTENVQWIWSKYLEAELNELNTTKGEKMTTIETDRKARMVELKAKIEGLRSDNRLKRDLIKNTKVVLKENKLKMRQLKAERLTI